MQSSVGAARVTKGRTTETEQSPTDSLKSLSVISWGEIKCVTPTEGGRGRHNASVFLICSTELSVERNRAASVAGPRSVLVILVEDEGPGEYFGMGEKLSRWAMK